MNKTKYARARLNVEQFFFFFANFYILSVINFAKKIRSTLKHALPCSLSANVLVMGIEHVRTMTPHAALRICT